MGRSAFTGGCLRSCDARHHEQTALYHLSSAQSGRKGSRRRPTVTPRSATPLSSPGRGREELIVDGLSLLPPRHAGGRRQFAHPGGALLRAKKSPFYLEERDGRRLLRYLSEEGAL